MGWDKRQQIKGSLRPRSVLSLEPMQNKQVPKPLLQNKVLGCAVPKLLWRRGAGTRCSWSWHSLGTSMGLDGVR